MIDGRKPAIAERSGVTARRAHPRVGLAGLRSSLAIGSSDGGLAVKIGLVSLSGLLFAIAIGGVGMASRWMPPLVLTALRLSTASIVFGIALAIRRPRVRWSVRTVALVAGIGLINIGAPFILLAASMRYISSSLASAIFNTIPAFTIVLAHFLLPDERLSVAKVLGTGLCMAGAVLLLVTNASGLASPHPQAWIGQLFIVLASLGGALSVILLRRHLKSESNLALTGVQVFACTLLFVPLAFGQEGLAPLATYPWQAWTAMVAAAIGAPILSYVLQLYILQRYSASLAGLSGVTTPLFSVAFGLLFLGEVLTAPIIAGSVLLLVGMLWLNRF